MSFRVRLPSKSTTFVILMVLAAVLSVLSARWSRWLRAPFQIIGLPQWALAATVHHARQGARAEPSPDISPTELRRENERLRLKVAGQEAWLRDLEARYDEVCGLRGQLWSDRVDILVAPVLGYDSSPRRATLLVGRGAESHVRPGQWVAAGVPPEDLTAAARSGRELLLERWLVGRVSEVQTHVSRVRLASDPKFLEPVVLAKVLTDGTWQPTDSSYVLSGRGAGRMEIKQADADFCALGYELVAIRPELELPAMLSIGRVVGSRPSEQSALHFDVAVAPWGDPYRLRYVYVVLARP